MSRLRQVTRQVLIYATICINISEMFLKCNFNRFGNNLCGIEGNASVCPSENKFIIQTILLFRDVRYSDLVWLPELFLWASYNIFWHWIITQAHPNCRGVWNLNTICIYFTWTFLHSSFCSFAQDNPWKRSKVPSGFYVRLSPIKNIIIQFLRFAKKIC